MELFNIVARITLDAAEYIKKLGDAENETKSFGSKIKTGLKVATGVAAAGAAAVGKAAVDMTKELVQGASETAAYGDSIDKMSQKLGLSAKAYQEWDYVMKISGTEISNMSTGLKTLTNKFDDAKNGSEDAQKMFAKLGLSMQDIQGLSREELFGEVITAFQGMEDSADRAALANDFFGRSGQELAPLFNTTAKETKNLIKQVNDLGGVMSDDAVKASATYQDTLTGMQTALSGMKRGILSEFLPSITSVMDGLTTVFSGGDGLGKIEEGINQFVGQLSEAVPRVLEIGTNIVLSLGEAVVNNLPTLIGAASNAVMTLGTGIVEQLPTIVDAGLKAILALATGISKSLPQLIPTIVSVVIQIVETLTSPKTLTDLLGAALQIILALADGLIRAIPDLLEALPQIISNLTGSLVAMAPQLIVAGVQLLISLGAGLIRAIPDLLTMVPQIIVALVGGIYQGLNQIVEVGENLVKGFWEGIKSTWSWLVDSVTGLFKGLFDRIKKLFGINSPSKVFRDAIGKNLMLGLAEGIDDESDEAVDALERASGRMMDVNFGQSYELTGGNNSAGENVKLLQGMLEEMQSLRRDIGEIILAALRENTDGLSVSDRDMARMVKKFAFA